MSHPSRDVKFPKILNRGKIREKREKRENWGEMKKKHTFDCQQ
jgi:hypothetical protein